MNGIGTHIDVNWHSEFDFYNTVLRNFKRFESFHLVKKTGRVPDDLLTSWNTG